MWCTPAALLYPAFAQLIHRGHDDHRMALESLGEHWAPCVTHGAARAMTAPVRIPDGKHFAPNDRPREVAAAVNAPLR